ncbi:MAG: ABC transporter permease [Eggerthellaceae bacterium]|jgi:ABC-2 type transport system permease protein
MNTFKAAVRIAARHRIYICIYLIALSLVGIPILLQGTSGGESGHEAYQTKVAVIDRDGSTVAQGLAAYLSADCELVDVADEPFAIQDALAQNKVDCVIVLRRGFGNNLLEKARAGKKLPKLEASYGTNVQAGVLSANEATVWLSLLGRAAALQPNASAAKLVKMADKSSGKVAKSTVAGGESASEGVQVFADYLGYSVYALFASICVCAGMMLTRFRTQEVRRRIQSSPQRPATGNLQLIGACCVLVAVAWAWVCGLGMVVGHDLIAGVGAGQLALGLFAMFLFCLSPLALAFTLSQFNVGEQALNAAGNIGGLAVAFLGGSWIPFDLVGEGVRAVAHFVPTYWVTDALGTVFASDQLSAAASGQIAADLGIVVLFAVAIALIGMAAARNRG